ncbi:MAG: hypothetical protein AAGN46_01105 [Acidobacteriota bacterium]
MTFSNRLAAISLVATLCVAAPGLAQEPGGGHDSQSVSRPTDIGSPADPQSPEDLKRTREALYGRALTDQEHARIVSWRTWDLKWWLDATRASAAKAEIASLDDYFSTRSYAATRGSEPAGLLGIELTYVDDGIVSEKDASVVGLVYASWSGATRPDLYSIHEAVHSVILEGVKKQGEGPGAGSLADVRLADDLSPEQLEQQAKAYLLASSLLIGANRELLREEVEARASGGALSAVDFEELSERSDAMESRVLQAETDRFLSALPLETRDSVLERAVRRIQGQTTLAVFAPAEAVALLATSGAGKGVNR